MEGNRLVIVVIVVLAVLALGYVIYNNRMANQSPSPVIEEIVSEGTTSADMEGSESGTVGKTVNVSLNPQNNSAQAGTATFEEFDGKTKVIIKLAGAPKGSSEPAHVHTGVCPNPGEIKYPLENVVDGSSEKVIDATMGDLKGMLPLVVNVHKSNTDLKTYVACGDVRF